MDHKILSSAVLEGLLAAAAAVDADNDEAARGLSSQQIHEAEMKDAFAELVTITTTREEESYDH